MSTNHIDVAPVRWRLAHTALAPQRGRPRPFGNFAPESISAFGYVRHAGRTALYLTPDEAVLLSPAFTADHCFEPVSGQGPERGLVGLAFAPVRTRRVPEVAGVLWADSATAALRYLQFWYVDDQLPPAVRGPGFTDGEIHLVGLEERRDVYKGYNPPSLLGAYDHDPYLHDGRLLTLEDTAEFFNLVLGLKLSDREKVDLVAFMRQL